MTLSLRALVADDEEAPRAQLIAALRKSWPKLQIVAECANGVDAWDSWLEHEPDLCFLDIRMPGLSGIDVARRIAGRTPVIFVSAHGDHALAAFEAGAIDYVMKPVDGERLGITLERVRRGLAEPAPAGLQSLLDQLAGQIKRPATLDMLQASVGKEVRQIRIDDVIYFEADARYTRIVYVADGEEGDALIRTPLKELLAQLDERQFWQVHRSVVVNRRQVHTAVRVDEGHMHLTLRGRDERLPVSRQFQGLFKGQ